MVRSIGFEFVYGPNNPPEVRARIRGRYEQAVYDVALRSVVENKNEISMYYQKPTIVEEEQLGSLAPYPVGPSIIIAPQEFHIYAYNLWADEVLYAIDSGYVFFNVHCHGDVGRFRVRHSPDADIENWWPDPPNHYKAGLNWLTNKNKYHIGYTISCYCGAFDRYVRPGTYPYGSDTCIADAFVDAYLVNGYNQIGPFGTCAYLANTRAH